MAEPRIVRAAAVQIAPDLDRPENTLERVLNAVADAAGKGARFVVFPETFVPYYPYFSFVSPPAMQGAEHLRLYAHAVVVPGPVTEAVSAVARRHGMVIVLGVNERDHGTLYNAQLIFDADGSLALKRRKITPTYHERMIWGQGDGAGLAVVDTAVGRVGALACWEHYNPLARYCLMTQHEEIHAAQFPGSLVGQVFADQMEVTIRHHALEAACFVVNATGWLSEDQIAKACPEEGLRGAMRGGCFTAIVSPEGRLLAEPLRAGEGLVIADMDLALVTKRKRMMDSVGHYARPELLSLNHDARPALPVTTTPPATNRLPATTRSSDHGQPAPDRFDRPVAGLPGSGPGGARPSDRAADQRAAILRSPAG
ncbi:Nit6803 family nitrilase [Methylobacterium sp. J-092]|uniref:Nit6803 family nitrilase n=1 Tax=Methylobacterium sp. J-092 TaxID=2836667 RepID=UPI001FBBC579|nr:Nit6803 family nitrilase [Methylobacterium sp. J-092]MCJ2007188.1 Nit6803 family nitriliase [Methylobacterium sp. J-092]